MSEVTRTRPHEGPPTAPEGHQNSPQRAKKNPGSPRAPSLGTQGATKATQSAPRPAETAPPGPPDSTRASQAPPGGAQAPPEDHPGAPLGVDRFKVFSINEVSHPRLVTKPEKEHPIGEPGGPLGPSRATEEPPRAPKEPQERPRRSNKASRGPEDHAEKKKTAPTNQPSELHGMLPRTQY